MRKFYATGSSTKLYIVISTLYILCGLQSCKKDTPVSDAGYSYFPNDLGHWVIYEVDSTIYNGFNGDTIRYRYQVKELIESYFTDNQGRQAMRIERYKRPYIDTIPYAQLPWTISRVWSFTRTQSEGEKNEENQRFIRLTFVPREGNKWNGNAYNTIGEWQYKYKAVDEPYSINSFSLDSTLLVEQKCDTNWLNYRWYRERYARHIGLIEKNVYDVADDSVIFGNSVLNRIHDGVIYSIKLVDWGPR